MCTKFYQNRHGVVEDTTNDFGVFFGSQCSADDLESKQYGKSLQRRACSTSACILLLFRLQQIFFRNMRDTSLILAKCSTGSSYLT